MWVPDHVVSPVDTDPVYPYRGTGRPSFDGSTPFADPLVMLGHLSAATSRIELGVGVYVLPLRHPLHAARSVMSAQVLSGGRVALGVGVGWMREEFDALGMRFERRGARTEEMVELMRRLWRGEPTGHRGEAYDVAPVQLSPPTGTPVPVLWGGTSHAALDRAARVADGWYGPPCSLDETLATRDDLHARLATAGRDPAAFRVVARCQEPAGAAILARMRDAGLTDAVVNVPRDTTSTEERSAWLDTLAGELTGYGLLP